MNIFNVYPKPDVCIVSDEKYYLPTKAVLKSGDISADAANLYSELWSRFSFDVSELSFASNDEKYAIIVGKPERKVTEGYDYSVHIDKNGIYLKAKGKKELCYAFTTLLQLIFGEGTIKTEKAYVYCGDYAAKAKIAFRALHFCLFPNVDLDFLKQFIRVMGMYRYSHLVLEFWGTYRYKCFDALGWKDGSYTKWEISPLIKEANALGMEVVPFFNHLGHAAQSKVGSGEHVVLGQHPEYAPLFENDGWTWCLSNPETLALLKNVREELIDLCGDGEYFHIGCDEAFSFCTCPRCRGKDKNKVLAEYLNGIAAEMKEKGRKVIMWGDQLLPSEKFKAPYEVNLVPSLETSRALADVSRDIIIADWQYRIYSGEVETSKYLLENGFSVVQSPWYNPDNIRTHIQMALKYGTGVLLTTWNVTQPFIAQLLHAAEMLWTGEEQSERAEHMSVTGNIIRKVGRSVRSSGNGWLGMWELY